MQVLVVEDEPLIAIEIEDILSSDGIGVIGPAASVSRSLELIHGHEIDAAVLDVNLGKESSEAVADELNRRGIPFVAVSGYTSDQRPRVFENSPYLLKPFRAQDLIDCVRCAAATVAR